MITYEDLQMLVNATTNMNINSVKCATIEKPKVVSDKTESVLLDSGDKMSLIKYNNGVAGMEYELLPSIKDVRIYNDEEGNPCATYVDFSDGKSTSAVRRHDDTFSIEHGISICITKKLLDAISGGAGNQAYNKLVRKAYKVYLDKIDAEEKMAKRLAEEEAATERKLKKIAEKKRRRDERRGNELREEMIEIQKEAFVRALREYCSATFDVDKVNIERSTINNPNYDDDLK